MHLGRWNVRKLTRFVRHILRLKSGLQAQNRFQEAWLTLSVLPSFLNVLPSICSLDHGILHLLLYSCRVGVAHAREGGLVVQPFVVEQILQLQEEDDVIIWMKRRRSFNSRNIDRGTANLYSGFSESTTNLF